jgi:hypothetical protein
MKPEAIIPKEALIKGIGEQYAKQYHMPSAKVEAYAVMEDANGNRTDTDFAGIKFVIDGE